MTPGLYATLVTLHVLGAAVWAGGHLVLTLGVLPGVLRRRDTPFLLRFEGAFERVGLPALALQAFTGVPLAARLVPDLGAWLWPTSAVEWRVAAKLGLLAATLALAVHARLRVIPRLDGESLPGLAAHIVAVTVLAVLLVIVGVSFRTGVP